MRVRACGYKCRERTALPYAGVGWLQGLGATLIRNVPANSVYLGSFEVMKREVAKRQDKPVSQLHPGVPASAVGGSIAASALTRRACPYKAPCLVA